MTLKRPLKTPPLFSAATPAQLAQVLRGFRKAARLAQREVATRGGLLQKTVSALESDPSSSSVETLYRLLSALSIELVLRSKGDAPRGPAGW